MTVLKLSDAKITSVDVGKSNELHPNTKVSVIVKEIVKLSRPDVLKSVTYRLRTPLAENPLYITISDIETEGGGLQPFEIFINTKNVESYQWMVVFTRLISSIFRRGGDVTFILEELKSVFDPNGGYMNKDGRVPSLVAEIGQIIEKHFYAIGLLKRNTDSETLAYLEEKRNSVDESKLSICPKCNQRTLVVDGGCLTCTNPECLYDKCG